MKNKFYHLIYNPFAKRGETKDDMHNFVNILKEKNVLHKLYITNKSSHATNIVKEITDSIPNNFQNYIIILGGDGTIFECINGYSKYDDIIFGVVALGTGNDVAKMLQIPLDIKKAADIIFNDNIKQLDYILVNNSIKSNIFASYGIASELVLAMNNFKTRNRLGYMRSLIARIVTYKAKAYNVTINGKTQTFCADFCSVHNNIYAGGGMHLIHNAKLDDGKLELLIVEYKGAFRRFCNLFAIIFKRLYKQPNVSIIPVSNVKIDAPNNSLCCIDGEILKLNSLVVSVVPVGVRFVC